MATAKPFITPMVFVLQYVETHGRASLRSKSYSLNFAYYI